MMKSYSEVMNVNEIINHRNAKKKKKCVPSSKVFALDVSLL